MSTEIMIPESSSIPAYILAMSKGGAAAENEAAMQGLSTGMPPRIKMNGKDFALVDAGGEEKPYPKASLQAMDDGNLYLPMVILKAKPTISKQWYLEAYNPNATEFKMPDCMSSDGVRPDAGVLDPQSESCATCPQNAFGSGRDQQGNPTKGKACTDNKIMAVLIPKYGIFQLAIKPASLKNFAAYVKKLSASGIPITAVFTYVSFDPAESYPVLIFQFGGFLPEAHLPALAEKAESAEVKEIIGVPSAAKAALPAPAPAPTAPAPTAPAPDLGADLGATPPPAEKPKGTRGRPKGGVTPVVVPEEELGSAPEEQAAPSEGPSDDDLAAALGL